MDETSFVISELNIGSDTFSTHNNTNLLPHNPMNLSNLSGSVTTGGPYNRVPHEFSDFDYQTPHTPSLLPSEPERLFLDKSKSRSYDQLEALDIGKGAFEMDILPSTTSLSKNTSRYSTQPLATPPLLCLDACSDLPNQVIEPSYSKTEDYCPEKFEHRPQQEIQYHEFVDSMFNESRKNVHLIGDHSCPLELMAVVMPHYSLDTHNCMYNQHQIMLKLRAPNSKYAELCTPYKKTPADHHFSDNMAYFMSQMLDSLGINVNLGEVRFYSRVHCDIVSENQLLELVLYRDYLLLVDACVSADNESPTDPRLVRMIYLKDQQVESSSDLVDDTQVHISRENSGLKASLGFMSCAAASIFMDMLRDDRLTVPLIPRDFLDFCQMVENKILPREKKLRQVVSWRTSYTVICVPFSFFHDPIAMLNIWARVADMDDKEQLYLIVYSSRGIHFLSGFIGPDLEAWSFIVSHRFMASMVQVLDLGGASAKSRITMNTLGHLTLDIIEEALKKNKHAEPPRFQMIIISNELCSMSNDMSNAVAKSLNEQKVDTLVVGIGKLQDPWSLNHFAESTNGHYVCLDEVDSLSSTLQKYQKLTQSGSLWNVSVKLSMKLNAKLKTISHDGTIFQPEGISTKDEVLNHTLVVGKMYGHETRTIFIDFEGNIPPPDKPILKVSTTLFDKTRGEDPISAVKYNWEVRAPPPEPQSREISASQVPSRLLSMAQVEYQLAHAFSKMQELLNCYSTNDRWRVATLKLRIFILSLKELKLDPEFNILLSTLYETSSRYLQACTSDAFTRVDLVFCLFRDLWALSSKRSLSGNDSFGAMFKI